MNAAAATAVQYPFSRSTDAHVDLSSQDAFNEGAPFATFDRMRREEPMAWCTESSGGPGFWSVTRHADLAELNKAVELLSSAHGIRIESQTEEEVDARRTFQETDQPQHRYFRMMVNKAFSKATMAGFEPQITGMVKDILDLAFKNREFDGVEAIARQLPMRMLGQILGVPASDADFLVAKGDALISNSDPDYTDFVIDKVDTEAYRLLPFRSPAAIELFDYANVLLDRMNKGEELGVLSIVRQETQDGRRMSDAEFRNFFCLLVAAGNDTTRYSIAAALHSLANQPALLESLRSMDRVALENATDELIRWASPTSHFRRTAIQDFEFHGKQVKKGDKVVLWFISGNRDESAFERPYQIDLSRKLNKFMSFGQGGPHVCLGMWLAKLEVRLVLEAFAKRVKSMRQVAPQDYLRSNFIHGIKRLPLSVEVFPA